MLTITSKEISETQIELTIVVDTATLELAKKHAVAKLGKNVKVPGFRPGKAPEAMIEKAIDPNVLAEEFLTEAINHAYPEAVAHEKLQPVARPQVEVSKFVPFSAVEFKAIVTILGNIKVGEYKNLGIKKEVVEPDKADIARVIDNMQVQLAERKDVERAAKDGDQAYINFDGKDAKGEAVNGAKGDNYPLVIGSKQFIPGFEENVIGMKPGESKEFTLTFPKDYGVKALQSKKVTFAVDLIKLQEIVKPELNEEFVKKVAPQFTKLADLEADIKKQLMVEAQSKADRDYENALVAKIVEDSEVALPEELIEEQAENVMRDLQQNLLYRGQTLQEYLEAVGMTAEEQREKEILPEARRRLKAGIIISEISEKENVTLTPEELKGRVNVLKQRYQADAEMLKQLDDANNQRELGAQMITEKTVAKIISLQ